MCNTLQLKYMQVMVIFKRSHQEHRNRHIYNNHHHHYHQQDHHYYNSHLDHHKYYYKF
jgi:hypothetical protein